MATEITKEVQCGRIGPNATSIGFIFTPEEVYLCDDLRRLCYLTNPTRTTIEYGRDNRQVYVKKGAERVIIQDEGEDRSIYVELSEDGILKFTNQDGDLVVFPRSDAYDFLAIGA